MTLAHDPTAWRASAPVFAQPTGADERNGRAQQGVTRRRAQPDAASDTVLVSGTITLFVSFLGDY